jgi:hypothetical protein
MVKFLLIKLGKALGEELSYATNVMGKGEDITRH